MRQRPAASDLFLQFALWTAITIPVANLNADVSIKQGDGKATVTVDGQPFADYVFDGHPKPIIYPIIGPHGIAMTRHFPMKDVDNEAEDHPHQKSLWFTHGNVNGIDFWLESREGSPRKGGLIVQKKLRIEGNRIYTENDWLSPEGERLCSDARVIEFGVRPAGRYIDYHVTLRASSGDVTFGDTKEGTMGVRTHPLLRLSNDERRGNHTAVGKCVNSEGIEGQDIWGKRAKWVDYWAPINGHTVGIAIFDHPTNLRHPTWWHARQYGLVAANPFGVHDFEKKPSGAGDKVIKSGDELSLRYRFLFHEGDAVAAKIKDEYAAFAESAPE